jgi:hypothetical protein
MATSTAHKFSFDPSRLRLTRLKEWRGTNLAWTTFVTQEAARLVAHLQRTQTTVDELAKIKGDKDLSDAARGRKILDLADEFLGGMKRSSEALRDLIGQAADWLPNLPGASDVEKDAASIALDTELRSAFRELGDSATAMIGPLASGEHPELLRALVRAPAFLSGLEDAHFATLKRAAIASFQRDLLEVVADATYVLAQFSAAVGNAGNAVRDAAGRSDLPQPVVVNQGTARVNELLRELRVGSINSAEWLDAALTVDSTTPEVQKQRIEAAHAARYAIRSKGGTPIEAERAAITAASSIGNPDERDAAA